MSEPTQDQDQPTNTSPDASPESDGARQEGGRVVVVTPDGMGVHDPATSSPRGPADLVEQPAKVMRIGSMVKQLLEEVRSSPLDEQGRARLAEVHRRSIRELEDGLAPELVEELERISLPFTDDAPSDAELRIAQAQLVGWLEGLFHGIQAALFAQQAAAQQQLAQMRQALPGGPGASGGQGHAGGPAPQNPGGPVTPTDGGPTGQYL